MSTRAGRRVEPTSRKRAGRGGASSATAARRAGARTRVRTELSPEVREAAALFGRLGGLKGGAARARALSAKRRSEIAGAGGAARSRALSDERRREIARAAARARWGKRGRA